MKDFTQKHKNFIRLILAVLTILLIYLIRNFIVSLILGVVFAAMLNPVYQWIRTRLKIKSMLAAGLTLLLFFAIVIIPSFFLVQNIISQAFEVSERIIPMVEQQIDSTNSNSELPSWFPFRDVLEPYSKDIYSKFSELIGNLGNLLIKGLTSATTGTFTAVLNFFIMLYAVFSFLTDGPAYVSSIKKYLPLTEEDFKEIKDEFIGVSRATIRGAFLIALIQGTLVGIGFYFAGISGPLFWGTVATFASLIPSLGAGLIYIPATIFLFASGHTPQAVGLLIWGVGIVSTIDNFLRPSLVGKEMQMSDLLVLVSTLGGITLFGISGIILGPMIVGLFTTFVKIYYNSEE